jgi:7,8-dihydropterin-6-yl-methyl-4-(beta-D-ribofuranosyl)aminobenzene 5'-phosphate synthase
MTTVFVCGCHIGSIFLELRVLTDNDALTGFMKEWGFSCLVGGDTLFDTGATLEVLRHNMDQMGISPSQISNLVISHDHSDHTGGLSILRETGPVKVFIPVGSRSRLRKTIISQGDSTIVEVEDVEGLSENIRVMGGFGGSIEEIVLVVDGRIGTGVITGCAHPGLDTILDRASIYSQLSWVMGGFHGFDRIDRLSEMDLIIPCHCTKRKEDILLRYPTTSSPCASGTNLTV